MYCGTGVDFALGIGAIAGTHIPPVCDSAKGEKMTDSSKPTIERPDRYTAQRGKFSSRPYDRQECSVSLRQWRILHAVIDCGGFIEAAKALQLSQSTISYTVSRLQENLGLPLLRLEGRKAVLTSEGRALLARSRQVLKEAIDLENYAHDLGRGHGGEVRLMVDHDFPCALLMPALQCFAQQAGGVSEVTLQQLVALQPEQVLRDAGADLVISNRVPLGFLGEPLTEIGYLPVAHAEHPLLRLGRALCADDLKTHIQIVVGTSAGGGQGPLSDSSAPAWLMNGFDSALAATLEGLGYAWLPAHRLHALLEQQVLRILPLPDVPARKVMLYLIHGRAWSASPAIGRMAEILRMACAGQSNRESAAS